MLSSSKIVCKLHPQRKEKKFSRLFKFKLNLLSFLIDNFGVLHSKSEVNVSKEEYEKHTLNYNE